MLLSFQRPPRPEKRSFSTWERKDFCKRRTRNTQASRRTAKYSAHLVRAVVARHLGAPSGGTGHDTHIGAESAVRPEPELEIAPQPAPPSQDDPLLVRSRPGPPPGDGIRRRAPRACASRLSQGAGGPARGPKPAGTATGGWPALPVGIRARPSSAAPPELRAGIDRLGTLCRRPHSGGRQRTHTGPDRRRPSDRTGPPATAGIGRDRPRRRSALAGSETAGRS